MNGYSKIFKSIFDSSIWAEPYHTRYLWMVMLVMADKDGIVDASIPGLVLKTGLTREQVLDALRVLQSPDPDSRTKEYDGVRIAETEGGGWSILNFDKYKQKLSRDDRREYNRIKQSEYREKKRTEKPTPRKKKPVEPTPPPPPKVPLDQMPDADWGIGTPPDDDVEW